VKVKSSIIKGARLEAKVKKESKDFAWLDFIRTPPNN
jgi:hypothetical protein